MPERVQKRFWLWFWPVIALAIGSLVWSVFNLKKLDWVSFLTFAAIGMATEFRSVLISSHQRFSVLFVVNLAAIFVFGLPAAMVNTLLGVVVGLSIRKGAWYKNLYNLAVASLSTFAAGWVFQVITQTPLAVGLFFKGSAIVRTAQMGALILPIFLAILAKYFVTAILLAIGKTLAGGGSPLRLWLQDNPKILLLYVPMGFISVVMAETYSIGGVLNVLAVVVPLLLTRYAFFLLSKAREAELRIAAELQNVLDGIPAAIIATDLEGKVSTFNRMAGKLTGLPSEAAVGKPLRELPVVSGLLATLEEGRREPGTISETTPPERTLPEAVLPETNLSEAALPQGEEAPIPIRARVAPFHDRKGTCQGQLLTFWDITAEKQLEAARLDLAKLSAFNQVAAALTHEMKNPLTIIRGYAEHLEETWAGGMEGREALGIIVAEADRLTAILEEVLDAARPSVSPPVPVNLREFFGRLESLMKAQCAREGISLEFAPDEGDPYVKATEDKLQRVFTNLFFNSLDAMSSGGRIRVSTRLLDHEQWVEIRVEDNGRGIRASDLPKVFDPFFSTKKHGTGLGLTNCAQIVRGYGGMITLESREGEGTTVSIRLPLCRK